MCVTVIADDVTFDMDDGLGGYRVQIVQRGTCEVEIILTQAVLQRAITSAVEAIEERESRKAVVLAFK